MIRSSLSTLSLLALSLLLAAGPAQAQAADSRLKKIAATKTITITYRADATPFSFTDETKQMGGFSIDLCKRVVSLMENQLKLNEREYVLRSRQGSTRQRRITTGILIGLIAGMLWVIVLLARPYVEDAIAKAQAQKLSATLTVPAGMTDIHIIDKSQAFILKEFSIEKQPVSNEVYDLCIKGNKCIPSIGSNSSNKSPNPQDPVVWITISQAATYCEWIGRRLPTAAEWERAAQLFAKPSQNPDNFVLTEVWEWTSSYQENTLKAISDDWNGQAKDLIFDWTFIQQGSVINSTKNLESYKNTSGALNTSSDNGFRCAQDK